MTGAALAVGVLAVTATLAVGCATAGAVSAGMVRLGGVADAAALAAADAAMGAVPGIPCEQAALIVQRGEARLESCEVDDVVATVTVSAMIGPFTAHARARAGPPTP